MKAVYRDLSQHAQTRVQLACEGGESGKIACRPDLAAAVRGVRVEAAAQLGTTKSKSYLSNFVIFHQTFFDDKISACYGSFH
ncbi:hypothetical protein [Burkholderia thailandensis]|uniref:hypothetical protein n=1 Tax=Burkholderia thailandensis TaxID=57975 RepID=UPI00016A4F1D|nr:hypothetical protein [Burkholderia thailandensis]MCS6467310.1 hypothetical protein [Burkholderia thailandensis]MDD1482581.1 hypothetical protein [Burkholderia thailandensis]MDD1486733.1 hypothetical protein [Burkholderia thailandensis]MDD1492871.1 hypothetical protein [Burkholderia thailandensis]PJO69239.1 hypothetical protein CWD92_27740 [Burkholderia thailandensis]